MLLVRKANKLDPDRRFESADQCFSTDHGAHIFHGHEAVTPFFFFSFFWGGNLTIYSTKIVYTQVPSHLMINTDEEVRLLNSSP